MRRERPALHLPARVQEVSDVSGAGAALAAAFACEEDLEKATRLANIYRPDEVVGSDIVRRSGGRVLLVDLLPRQGTTATIALFKERTRAAG
jgi:bifunctional ADP-heptose synthase (sugar kinase/adenylyltransferase)